MDLELSKILEKQLEIMKKQHKAVSRLLFTWGNLEII
jgi:hypothetical protein